MSMLSATTRGRSSGSTRCAWKRSRGFARKEIGKLLALVTDSRLTLLETWNDYFHG